MVSPVITSMRIPEVVYPPIPGEQHRYYGNIHLKQLKLPSNSFNHNIRGTTSYPRYSEDGSIESDLDIHEAAAAGNFTRVKELLAPQGSVSGETTSAFLIANEFSPSSGLTPLHYAASRGHYEIVRWLIDEAGAIVDLEDQTGETALLKASYNGHSSVVAYLLQKQANVIQRDNDGWTALHNASAQGYLTIVKYFIEHTEADANVKSNKGHTPLMNAASKGNIEIVEYLLNRGLANPFVKNSFGETAYDVAATSQEVYVCELLEKAEREWWKGKRPLPPPTSFKELVDLPNTDQPYDLYAFHITVPVILHENQRSPTTTFSLSIRGPPKYSVNNLLKSDRAPWTHLDGKPTSKDGVRLPVGPTSSTVSIVSVTSSKPQKRWFWVTDWQIDMTHPRVDSQGWQYAKSFEEHDKNWHSTPQSNNGSWVRRRRWVRVMKRRVDLLDDGSVLQLVQDNNAQRDSPDYVERAEAIIKKVQDNKSFSEADQLGQYKEAIAILLAGSKTDTNAMRKQEANSLASSFMTHAEHLDNRLNRIGNDAESFKDVPMTPTHRSSSPNQFKFESPINRSRSVTPTITNLNNPSTTSLKSFETMESPWNNTVQSNDASSPVLNDSAMVSPTRSHPQTSLSFTNVQANNISPFGKWENDDEVHECRNCHKKFNLWIRRHHCRRCGRVFCDKCSTARVDLPKDQVISDPSQSGESSQSQHHRVCDSCFTSFTGHTPRPRSSSFTSTTFVPSSSSTNHRRRLSNNSTISTMTECPVCNTALNKIPGGKSAQEEHVSKCFENKNGNGGVVGYKYVVYKLPQNNPLVGQECPICFEEYLSGETVTRMNCLCSYHYHCIHDWFAKGGECPIHFL